MQETTPTTTSDCGCMLLTRGGNPRQNRWQTWWQKMLQILQLKPYQHLPCNPFPHQQFLLSLKRSYEHITHTYGQCTMWYNVKIYCTKYMHYDKHKVYMSSVQLLAPVIHLRGTEQVCNTTLATHVHKLGSYLIVYSNIIIFIKYLTTQWPAQIGYSLPHVKRTTNGYYYISGSVFKTPLIAAARFCGELTSRNTVTAWGTQKKGVTLNTRFQAVKSKRSEWHVALTQ